MAASLTTLNTDGTASWFLPVSRLRPSRELIDLAGVDFCRDQSVVPMWREGGAVVVATALSPRSAVVHELERRLRQRVVVRPASSGEIPIAIANALGEQPASVDRRRALAHVLTTLRLVTEQVASAYAFAAENEPYLGAALVEEQLLTEQERLEAVGLAFCLPSLDLVAHPPTSGLRTMVAGQLGDDQGLVPLWALDGELFVACAEPPALAALERIEHELGMAPRPVLVSPRQLAALPVERPPHGSLDAIDLATVLLEARVVSAGMLEDARRVVMQTRETLTEVLQRVAGVREEEVRIALARTLGHESVDPSDAEPQALALLPPRLAARLGAIAVHVDRRRVTVGMLEPWDETVRAGVAALLDAEVRPALISQPALQILLARAEAQAAAPARPGDVRRGVALLLRAGFVDRLLARSLDIDVDRPGSDMLDELLAVLDDRARADAVALDHGLPRLHVLMSHPDRAAAEMAEQLPGAFRGAAVWHDGEVLTVAVTSPAAVAVPGEQTTALRLAISSHDDIDSAHAALAVLELRDPSDDEVRFGRLLELRWGLARADVLTLLRRKQTLGEPTDIALARLRVLTPRQIGEAFAQLHRTAVVRLRREERLRTDARGDGGGLRRELIDPVDPALARLLTREQADRLGALPYAHTDGTLLVAMADPLSEQVLHTLDDLLAEPFFVRPATRVDLHEATLRVHGHPSVGELLLEDGLLTPDRLDATLDVVERSGVPLTEALISLGAVTEEDVAERVARQHGLPFVTLRRADLNPDIARLLPEQFVRDHQLIPIAREDDVVSVAIQDPGDEAVLAEVGRLIGSKVRFAVTTRTDIRDALERLYHRAYLEMSATGLRSLSPENSAYRIIDRRQKVVVIGCLALLIGTAIRWPVPTVTAVLACATAFYVSFSIYKFYLIVRSLSHHFEVEVTDEQIAALDDRDLPVYTILVPLYHESAVLPILVRSLTRLDYPKEKMDVKLLLEEDDVETIAAARSAQLPPFFDVTIVPNGQPKGKPKACNYGLLHARGEYAVIFDAEDIPDPDQLKRVLAAFHNSLPHVVCVQAKLSYYNRNQNILTKWFTAEYALWFDLLLPGLDASGAPIPLGGTSNHFKLDALRRAGAWDPFNVTEDADLGLRIFKIGGATAVVDSTTYEEANSVLDNWIRQRSRWVKGYIQTYLVHMRHPFELLRSLGFGGFVSFQFVIGGTVFSFLFNPVLWGVTGAWFLTRWELIQQVFPAPVYYAGAISLYAGNFAFAYMNVAGCLRRRYYALVKWALLSPLYWVLMSIAAWKGFLQLFYRPFYWEKTVHGLADANSMESLARLTSGRGE